MTLSSDIYRFKKWLHSVSHVTNNKKADNFSKSMDDRGKAKSYLEMWNKIL
jgi:hypothetical protein